MKRPGMSVRQVCDSQRMRRDAKDNMGAVFARLSKLRRVVAAATEIFRSSQKIFQNIFKVVAQKNQPDESQTGFQIASAAFWAQRANRTTGLSKAACRSFSDRLRPAGRSCSASIHALKTKPPTRTRSMSAAIAGRRCCFERHSLGAIILSPLWTCQSEAQNVPTWLCGRFRAC